jgi:hypothetical protein
MPAYLQHSQVMPKMQRHLDVQGVEGFPWFHRACLLCAGCVGCFLLCIILGGCEAFTLYVLSKFAERYQAHTYSGLVRKALGRKLSASEHLNWPTHAPVLHAWNQIVL